VIQEIARKYNFTVAKDECGDPVILGACGHLYESGEQLGLYYMGAKWSVVRGTMRKSGAKILLDCEGEGFVLVDPLDRIQLNCALRVLVLTPKESKHLAKLQAERLRLEAPRRRKVSAAR